MRIAAWRRSKTRTGVHMGRYNFMRLLAVFIILALAGIGSAATVTYNWSFASNNQSWVSNYTTTGGVVTMEFITTDGNPAVSNNRLKTLF